MKLVFSAVAACVVLLTSCSSSGGRAASTSSAPAVGSSSAAARVIDCASLPGRRVKAGQSCDDHGVTFDAPGAAGCYPGDRSKRVSSFYYFGTAAAMVYGRPGGVWHKTSADASVSTMAKSLGC